MASTYSPLLGIELMGIGDQDNTWGTTNNTNLGTLIEQAIAGTATVDVTAGDVTLTDYNGTSNQARNAILRITGTPGTSRNIITPATSKTYYIINGSDADVVIKTSVSTGVTIPSGSVLPICFDTTSLDFLLASYPASAVAVANTLVLRDALGSFGANVVAANEFVGDLNGTINTDTTAATQTAGNNSTKVATTAYADNAIATSAATKANVTTTITAGTGLTGGGDLSANRTLSITSTGVSAATYGSTTKIPVIAVNAQGQITTASEATIVPFAWNTANVNTVVANGTTGSYTIPANCIMVMGSNLHSMGGNTGSRVNVQIKNSAGTVLYDYPLTGGNEFNGGDGGSGMFVRSAWSVSIPAAAAGGTLTFYRSSGSNNSWSVQVNQYVSSV